MVTSQRYRRLSRVFVKRRDRPILRDATTLYAPFDKLTRLLVENSEINGDLKHMSKLAIVATIKTAPGKREEYLRHLKAHAERSLSTESGTLKFELLVPQKEADTIMLYEVYTNSDAFETHRTGASIQQLRQDTKGLQTSLTGVFCDLVE